MSQSARAAALLDRDGTITAERGYITRPEDLELLPGAAEAVRALNDVGLLVVVVSNQSGVARGLLSESDMAAVHGRLEELLAGEGARVDAAYYCPNHRDGTVRRYARDWSCRKPDLGMLEAAVRDLGFDVPASTMVGDQATDIEFANRAGIPGVMVLTGKGEQEIEVAESRGLVIAHVAKDLAAATEWIVEGRPGWVRGERS